MKVWFLSRRTKELLLISLTFTIFFSLILFGWLVFLFLFTTRYWLISALYSVWWYFDRDTAHQGGIPKSTIRLWKEFKHTGNYFPASLTLADNFSLDPERNYLFCCYPHGVYPIGTLQNLSSNSCGFADKFPHFEVKLTAIWWLHTMPFIRDLTRAFGFIACTAESIYCALKRPGGGNIVVLIAGGAQEAFNAKPGKYKFVVKHRKGFVKIALKTGAPLVPAITFGEINVFNQIDNKVVRRLQILIKKWFGFAPVFFYGRGLWGENSIGWIPRRTPLDTVVGLPIEVPEVANPTFEDIDRVHKLFVERLVQLFETYKHKFLENPEQQVLELE